MKKINILKIEGLGDLSSGECLIYSDDQIIHRSSLESSSSIQLDPFSTSLKIIIADRPSGLFFSSLSINPQLFNQPGLQWLPLSLSDDDTIEELQELVTPPRVLLDIQMDLSPFGILITESSESGDEIQRHTSQERTSVDCQVVGLMIKVTELENSLNLVKRNSEIEIEETVSKFREKVKKLRLKVEQLKEVVKLKEITIQDQRKDFETLKLSLEKALQDKNELLDKVSKLERLYESFYKYSIPMQSPTPISPLSPCPQSPISPFCLSNLKPVLSLCIARESEVWVVPSYKSQDKSQGIYILSSKLVECEKKLKKFSVIEEIETKVKFTLASLGIEGLLRLANEAVYYIGNKKINVFICKEITYVRQGGFSKTLESYIASCCGEDIDKFLKSRNSKESSPSKSNSRSINGFDSEKIQNPVVPKPINLDPKLSHKSRSKLSTRSKLFEPLAHSLSSRHIH